MENLNGKIQQSEVNIKSLLHNVCIIQYNVLIYLFISLKKLNNNQPPNKDLKHEEVGGNFKVELSIQNKNISFAEKSVKIVYKFIGLLS